jgi:hypothetical protein
MRQEKMPDAEDEEKTGSGAGQGGRRVSAVYIAALYGSILATLAGLYLAATRLGRLSPEGALGLVGLCGALVLGTMLPITLRSLRSAERGPSSRSEEARRRGGASIRIVGAACLGLIAVGVMMAGYAVPAALVAFLAIALVYRFALQAKR